MKYSDCVGTVVTCRSAVGGVRVRSVKQTHEGRTTIPQCHLINGALIRLGNPGERHVLRIRPGPGRWNRVPGAGREIDLPAGDQQTVSQLFDAETTPIETPDEIVARISGIGLGTRFRRRIAVRLPISGREHHEAVHRFDAPARFQELRGQPVEQLRMRRTLPRVPKSLGDCTSPLPK